MPDLPENFFGKRYVPQELLGTGGMGRVYRAYDRLTRGPVALKQVLNSRVDSSVTDGPDTNRMQEFRLALAQEFHTLSSLRHPHIISVLDYGFDTAGQPFFTMELLENHQSIVAAAQELSLSEKIELF